MLSRKGAAAVLAIACPGTGFAAEMPVTHAPPVVVTATRFEEPHDDLPVGVTVITADEIRRGTASTVAEVLSRFAGIHIRDSTGGPDPQLDMRGFGITGDQNTLVLLNGQRLSEIELVSPALSAIPLDAIERIEIMRGSGAILYGGGATGGTINIVTRTPRPGERSARLSAGAGSYDTRELRATGVLAGQGAGLAASAHHLETDNYRENNRSRQRSAELDFRLGDAARYVNLKLGGDELDLRNPGARTSAQLATDRRGATTPDDFSSRSGARVNLAAGGQLGAGDWAINLTYREREARSTQSFFGATTQLETRVDHRALSPRWRIPLATGAISHTLVVGADVDDWDYDSVFLGGFFSSHARATQRNRAFYVQDNVRLAPGLRLMAGARRQRTDNAVMELLPAPAAVARRDTLDAHEAAVRYRPAPGVALFGKMGRSFRVATVDESRFQPTLLEPQTSRDAELGGELDMDRLRLRAALFRMRLRNEIQFNPLFGPFGANVNLSPTQRQGLELDTRWRLTPALTAFANYARVEAKFRSGVYGGVDVTGNDVPLVPRQTLALGGAWRMAGRTELALFARHVGRQRFDNDQANTFAMIPEYTTLDARLSHRSGGWLFAATARNLTGEQYYSYGIRNAAGTDFNAYPAPGRAFFVSAGYRLP